MCFSAGASFAGGVVISAVGVATLMKVHKPSQLVFGSIPLFFGIQQIAEGFLWMTLPDPEYIALQKISTYWFLIMADVIWPVMIPLSVLMMEENSKRRKTLKVFLGIGLILGFYYGACLAMFDVRPQIVSFHVQYNTDFPVSLSYPAFFVYLLATITPLFLSSIRRTQLLGMLMFISCLITGIFFSQFLTSVWCFFAALISGVIYWILSDSKKEFNLNKLILAKIRIK